MRARLLSTAPLLLAGCSWFSTATPPPPDVSVAACAGCHPAAVTAWQGSHHALAERARADVSGAPTSVDLDGTAHAFDTVIGVEPLWQPLVPAAGGRLQTSNRAWDVAKGAWYDVFTDVRAPGDWGHWSGGGMTWNSQCAHCHDTGVRVGWDPVADTYTTTHAERGVTCQACHGGLEAHVTAAGTTRTTASGREQVQATCERCHTRGVPLVDAPAPGTDLLDVLLPELPGASATWWPDGGLREESFEGGAFRTSTMWAAGIRCVDCHDVHTGRTLRDGDALCLGCHAKDPDAPQHDHHAKTPESPRCTDCHMPTTTYMGIDARHDHGFRVPDPALARELGTPDACTACHTDDADAVVAAAESWWKPDDAARARARALALAERSGEAAATVLTAAARTETHPGWLVALVAAGATPPAGAARPWQELAEALSPSTTPRRLDQLTRSTHPAVRLAAARRRLPQASPKSPIGPELSAWLTAHAYSPDVAGALGEWTRHHGEADDALRWLTRARDLDPGSPATWHALAVQQAAMGKAADALDTLDRAIVRHPQDAELRFARALGFAGAGRFADAEASLRDALKLDPRHGRAAYNLALLKQQQGLGAEAVDLLRTAMDASPEDPGPPWALATILAQQGDTAGALAAAKRTLALDPRHPDARLFVKQAEAPAPK